MRHRDGVAHVRRMMPRGSVGQQIVGKQGPTCSTCTVRRRISTKAAQAYAASKRQRHDLQQPKSNSGQKKTVLKGPGERKESRVAKAKALAKEATTDDAEASDGGESVEPEASESDREVEVETKEEPDVEEVKAHEDVATEEYEDVVEEAAEEEAAESSKGQGKGHVASTGSRTGASPVGTTGDVGTTVSSSSAMHNLLVKSLSSILDGAMPEVGQVGGPDPHEEANFEEHHHNVLPSAKELYVKEPVIDANTGVELDPKKVATARATKIAWVQRQKVYEKVDESTCYEETGKPPITLKRIDRNKGEQENENYRSRLVVRELKSQGQAALIPEYALFSSMPPLQALKLMCSLLVTLRASRNGGAMALKLTDISRLTRAFLRSFIPQNLRNTTRRRRRGRKVWTAIPHYVRNTRCIFDMAEGLYVPATAKRAFYRKGMDLYLHPGGEGYPCVGTRRWLSCP